MTASQLLAESLGRYWTALSPHSLQRSPYLSFAELSAWGIISILSLLLVAALIVRAYVQFVYRPLRLIRHFKKQGMKGPPFKLLVGQMSVLKDSEKVVENGGKNMQYMMDWKKEYGSIFYYCIGPKVRLAILDPALLHQVLHTTTGNGGHYRKNDYGAEVFEPVLGKHGLVFASNAIWSRQRKLVNPMFSHSKLKDMEPFIVSSTEEMVRRWEAKIDGAGGRAEIEVNQELSTVARDVICRAVFGQEDGAESAYSGQDIYHDFENLLKDIAARSFGPQAMFIPFYKYLPIPINVRIARTRARVRAMILSLINNRRAKAAVAAKANGGPPDFGDDLLGSLLAASDEQGSLSSEELIDQCKTFFFAGHETSGHALTWTLLLLGQHPEWQERARAEVREHCGSAPPNKDSANKLKVVTMVLRETMRLFPPVPFTTRQVSKPQQLGPYAIPQDDNLVIAVPIYPLHRDPATWGADADVFNPERFENGPAGAATDARAYIPFASGPRNCVGQQLAMLETKMVLAMVLQRFRFSVAPGYRHWPHNTITLRPKLGLPLLVEKVE
ncbi:cytochrome P450 [Klebsormidium nitens]|uniref:Cytochrome P450 n=1 Tax=Klebsormidium nitens TaxID=105231 RepID=A0A1Y1ILB9_KLENI|nr:cytochrome P450 [Klebsormidium nitens]|eukprot:GAQ88908.1 cytochrome P450 [Klebsormidium nitens]